MLKIISNDNEKDLKYKEKIINELIENKLNIYIYNSSNELVTMITEDSIISESMTLKQSICDEEKLKLGGCIASEFNIQIVDTEEKSFSDDLVGKKIFVSLTQTFSTGELLYPSSEVYPSKTTYPGETVKEVSWMIFFGEVDSAKRDQSDKNIRNLVAYDPMSKYFSLDISNSLYSKLKENKATVKNLISLCLGSNYNENDFEEVAGIMSFRNYEWEDEKSKNKNKTTLSKGELLRDICEVSGGYGFFRPSEIDIDKVLTGNVINTAGKIRLIKDDTTVGTETYDFYEDLTSEEQAVKDYVGVLFPYAGEITNRGTDDGWGDKTGYYQFNNNEEDGIFTLDADRDSLDENGTNYYDLSENILAWDYSNAGGGGQNNLGTIRVICKSLNKMLKKETSYIPLTVILDGRPWVEVGDNIKIKISRTNVYGDFVDENGNAMDVDGYLVNSAGDYIDENGVKTEEPVVGTPAVNEITTKVLSRTLSGIQALTDTIEVKGEL